MCRICTRHTQKQKAVKIGDDPHSSNIQCIHIEFLSFFTSLHEQVYFKYFGF